MHPGVEVLCFGTQPGFQVARQIISQHFKCSGMNSLIGLRDDAGHSDFHSF